MFGEDRLGDWIHWNWLGTFLGGESLGGDLIKRRDKTN